jgi:predicted DNA-binding transcriptional regulator YafY
MAGKFSVVLDDDCRAPLEQLAQSLGYVWGEGGNVKAMVQAIAQQKLSVGESTAFTEAQRQALGRAAIAACDRGEWQDALALGTVFQALPIEDEGLRALVDAKLELLQRPWVAQVFEAIAQEQPFKLSYQDAAGRLITFTVCGAEFVPHDRRIYLDCWCIETEGNQDILRLQHNWCLRLDRITDAGIIPIKKKWRSLDTIEIEMVLSGGLAHAYGPRNEDTLIEWIEGDRKRVMRKITNSFWFLREILRYGKDCQVIAPLEIRDRIRIQLAEAVRQYD